MNLNYLPLLVCLFVLAGCKKDNDPVTPPAQTGLNGTWNAKGYTCPTATTIPEQTISIMDANGKLTATKVTGDACVPAGKVTFVGTYDETKNLYNLNWTTGTATAPASSTSSPGTLTVVSNNRLVTTISGLQSVTLTR